MIKIIDPTSDILTEGSKLGTVTIDKPNDDDLAALTKSATIKSLIALVLDLQARVKALEATVDSQRSTVVSSGQSVATSVKVP